jgi:hypothetical protein
VRGREILRSSSNLSSAKFVYIAFSEAVRQERFKYHSFGVCAGALLGNTITSLLSRTPPHPPPRNGEPAFLFVSGGPLERGNGPKCVLRLAYPVRVWGSIGAQPDVNLGGGVGLCKGSLLRKQEG